MNPYRIILPLLLLIFAATVPTWAQSTTYTYVGPPFTTFSGGYTCPSVCNISGSFTTAAPLAPNLPFAAGNVSPTSFSFTDGVNVASSSNGAYFGTLFISTDSNGNIAQYQIDVRASEALDFRNAAYYADATYPNSGPPPEASTFNVAGGVWTTVKPTHNPSISPASGAYKAPLSVTIIDADTSSGAVIYYTLNGTTPTHSSAVYSGTITLSTAQLSLGITLKAIADVPGYTDSGVVSATYTLQVAATPTFSPAGGTYTSPQTVTISSTAGPGLVIFYTTDGSTPTPSSPIYTAPVAVGSSETIKAIATATGDQQSAVGSATYTLQLPQTHNPIINPNSGVYTAPLIVTIIDADSALGAVIYYTLDGSPPTLLSPVYSGTITLSTAQLSIGVVLEAMADIPGYPNSGVTSANYNTQPQKSMWTLQTTGVSADAIEQVGNWYGSTNCPTVCEQPVFITFDLNADHSVATLGGTTGGANVLISTDSIWSLDGGVASLSVLRWCSIPAVDVYDESGGVYWLYSTLHGGNFCATPAGTSSSGNMLDVNGNSPASYPSTLTEFPDPSGIYNGSFNDSAVSLHSQGGGGNSTLTLAVNPDFSVNATLALPGTSFLASCFVGYGNPVTFTTTDPTAINWGVIGGSVAAVISGDVILMSIGDGLGDTIWLTATDTDANGNLVPAGSLFVTGYVANGNCTGLYFFDAPFTKKGAKRGPLVPGHHHHVDKRMAEFLKRKK